MDASKNYSSWPHVSENNSTTGNGQYWVLVPAKAVTRRSGQHYRNGQQTDFV